MDEKIKRAEKRIHELIASEDLKRLNQTEKHQIRELMLS